MTVSLERELSSILEAVQVLSDNAFSFAGGPPVTAASHEALVEELQHTLYYHCYSRDFDGSPPAKITDETADAGASLAKRLADANRSQSRWDDGWRIYRLGEDGEVQVKKGERHRSPLAGEYAFSAGPGMRPKVGDDIHLQVLRESHQIQPGIYFVFGETLPDQFDDFDMVRFYFHAHHDASPILVGHMTEHFNRYQVPFHMKCQKYPVNYDRKDACVVYFARRYFDVAAYVVANLPESYTSRLKPTAPLFCKALRPGIGLAEDPRHGQSFGLHRCKLLAEGILDAWKQKRQTDSARLDAVKQRFSVNSLDFDRPYLNPGSVDFELDAAGSAVR